MKKHLRLLFLLLMFTGTVSYSNLVSHFNTLSLELVSDFRSKDMDSPDKVNSLSQKEDDPTDLPFTWPAYEPGLNYNFQDEFPGLEMPIEDLDDCPQVVRTQSSEWWTYKEGPNANPVIKDNEAAVTKMLERLNKDFAYFRDEMGWPPDKRAKNGYRSAVYLFGSGLCTDNEPNTALGGWQSSIRFEGQDWPMVLLSYYPVYSFDPECTYGDKQFQMGAVVHEGIHSILADLPGCRNAGWFHEGGNTWLQQEADARRSGDYSTMGFLNGVPFIAPFIPIECYSGWLQDDSFGGPSAEGVNKFEGGKQLCTWRKYLGGNQYGNTFPVFLSQTLGDGSVPWIWRYAKKRVLEGIADTLGDLQTRRLITEYRAKQCLLDMGEWTGALKKQQNSNFKMKIGAEWQPSWLKPPVWIATPYAITTKDEDGWLVPEYRTTPGWSGANQIPLLVKEDADSVVVDFKPMIAGSTNMSCQLVYRTKEGKTVYGYPINAEGKCKIALTDKPANNVVFAVISNTDYLYKGEVTRKAHFDYRLKYEKGVVRAANVHLKWFNWETETEDEIMTSDLAREITLKRFANIYPNPVERNETLKIDFLSEVAEAYSLSISNIQGQIIYRDERVFNNMELNMNVVPGKGIYFISLDNHKEKFNLKLVVN